MAVKSRLEKDKLILEIDNGDKTKLEKVIEEWNFKDYQSFLRFVVSVCIESNDKKTLAFIDEYSSLKEISPADHLLLIKNIQTK